MNCAKFAGVLGAGVPDAVFAVADAAVPGTAVPDAAVPGAVVLCDGALFAVKLAIICVNGLFELLIVVCLFITKSLFSELFVTC